LWWCWGVGGQGNIRVFCRVRPLSEAESAGTELGPAVAFPGGGDDESIELSLQATGVQDGAVKQLKHNFSFDRVRCTAQPCPTSPLSQTISGSIRFAAPPEAAVSGRAGAQVFQPQAGQQVVFEEITQLVQSALDGYKVCIFAYGQTGSGKTHTMMGSEGELGMIPRSLQQIFAKAAELSREGWTFQTNGTQHPPPPAVGFGERLYQLASRPKRRAQDWFLKCLQGGRVHPLAARAVATLWCSPPALLETKKTAECVRAHSLVCSVHAGDLQRGDSRPAGRRQGCQALHHARQ
jgi:hypothetical protein